MFSLTKGKDEKQQQMESNKAKGYLSRKVNIKKNLLLYVDVLHEIISRVNW